MAACTWCNAETHDPPDGTARTGQVPGDLLILKVPRALRPHFLLESHDEVAPDDAAWACDVFEIVREVLTAEPPVTVTYTPGVRRCTWRQVG